MINHGHKKIGYISGPVDGISTAPAERFTGFKTALEKHHLFDEFLLVLNYNNS